MKWQKRDRYQRILGKVLVDGQDVNSSKSRQGWHGITSNTERPSSCLYGEAEEFAKVNGMGLWRDPAPVAPWDSGARNVRYQLQMKRARARLLEPGTRANQAVGLFWMF